MERSSCLLSVCCAGASHKTELRGTEGEFETVFLSVDKFIFLGGKIGRENQRKEFSENEESGKKESLCKQQVLRSRNIDILISEAAVRIRDDEASQRRK